MIAKTIAGLIVVCAASLCALGHRVRAGDPAKEPGKREVPALATQIVKMKVVRVENEARETDRAEKTLEDKEKIGQLLALFPEVGTDKEPDTTGLVRGSGASYQIALQRDKGEPLYITISGNRMWWAWSQGTAVPKGEWDLKMPKEVGKFLDELLK